eukprot:c1397_g1_i1.p1 GENE.c1397_g1_i1~~c1397_g1_i1.p1  ORF type:complete len:433 (+),score=89.92 c1397_g1_i1:132-1301(+)
MHKLSLSYASPISSPTVPRHTISNGNTHNNNSSGGIGGIGGSDMAQLSQHLSQHNATSSFTLSESFKSKRHGSDSLTLLASLPLISDTTTTATSTTSPFPTRHTDGSPKPHRHQSWPYSHQRSSPSALVSPPHSPASQYQPLFDPSPSSSHRSFSSMAPSPVSSPHQSPSARHLSPLSVRRPLPNQVNLEHSQAGTSSPSSPMLHRIQQQQKLNDFNFSMPSRSFSTDNHQSNRYSLAAQLGQQQQQQPQQQQSNQGRTHPYLRSYSEPGDGSPRSHTLSPKIPSYSIQSLPSLSQSLPSSPISSHLSIPSPTATATGGGGGGSQISNLGSPRSSTMSPSALMMSGGNTGGANLKTSLSALPSISSLHLPQPTSLPKSRLSEEHSLYHS